MNYLEEAKHKLDKRIAKITKKGGDFNNAIKEVAVAQKVYIVFKKSYSDAVEIHNKGIEDLTKMFDKHIKEMLSFI